jgi:glycosyltransferase involved in cell wall biosynthesis
MAVTGAQRARRVACPQSVRAYPPQTGVGTMWQHVLAELQRDLTVRFVNPGRRRRRFGRPDVWLHDGHAGPLEVREPSVIQLHEAAWDDPVTRASLDPAFAAAYESASRRAAEGATRIITPSESSRQQISASYGMQPEHIVVAPHGVDHSVFNPGATGGRDFVARAGGDPGRPYVIFVSQLHPRKNLAALREAMARLAGRGYPHRLVLVGGPPADRPDGQELVRAAEAPLRGSKEPVTRFQGLTDAQLAMVTAGASAFCLPSLMEGFGLTALEAMACGVPVVVSDRGALPEVVGDAGIVTAPNAEAIECALMDLLADDNRARELRAAGFERSRAFTWRATARCWRRALDDASGETGRVNGASRGPAHGRSRRPAVP